MATKYQSAYTGAEIDSAISKVDRKQDTLVSGTNIKSLNGKSVLGTGDLNIITANPSASATEDLSKISIYGTIYNIKNGADGGAINTIQVNGTPREAVEGVVNIDVPVQSVSVNNQIINPVNYRFNLQSDEETIYYTEEKGFHLPPKWADYLRRAVGDVDSEVFPAFCGFIHGNHLASESIPNLTSLTDLGDSLQTFNSGVFTPDMDGWREPIQINIDADSYIYFVTRKKVNLIKSNEFQVPFVKLDDLLINPWNNSEESVKYKYFVYSLSGLVDYEPGNTLNEFVLYQSSSDRNDD